MQTHAGNGRRQHSGARGKAIQMVTSNRATVTFDLLAYGQRMSSDCYRVYVYQVWC